MSETGPSTLDSSTIRRVHERERRNLLSRQLRAVLALLLVGVGVLLLATGTLLGLLWLAIGVATLADALREGRRAAAAPLTVTPDLADEVRDAAGEGGRVAAVRLLRKRTGTDLRTAVRVVDLLAEDRRSLV